MAACWGMRALCACLRPLSHQPRLAQAVPCRWPFDSFLRPFVRILSAFIVIPMMAYFMLSHRPPSKFPIIQAVIDDLKAERGEATPHSLAAAAV